MDEEREDGGPTSKTTLSGEHGRRNKAKSPEQQQRADSPGPSCVYMKSDRSMGTPPDLKDGRPSREKRQRMSNMRRTGTRGLVPVFSNGCSNNLCPRGALVGESRMNGSQRGFILKIHFSHHVIFCQVI
ncbi:unnamed protein product [Boreogadus saida]